VNLRVKLTKIVYLTVHLSVYIHKCMNYISTTGLRTQSSELVDALLAGKTVDLIHRSKLIGRVVPIEKNEKSKKSFYELILSLPKTKKTTIKEREKIYKTQIMKKYGKSISRH